MSKFIMPIPAMQKKDGHTGSTAKTGSGKEKRTRTGTRTGTRGH